MKLGMLSVAAAAGASIAASASATVNSHTGDLDLILYGATGCVGHLTAHYLAAQESLTWAIADINATRLADLADALAASPSKPEVILARLDGSTNLTSLVLRARAVATAAGPFSVHDGAALVQACAENGVHYADVSDEFFWQREMVEKFNSAASKSGAQVVLASGFCALAGELGSQLALSQLDSRSAAYNASASNRSVDAWLERYNGGISAGVEHTPHNSSYPPAWNDDPYVLAPSAPAELVVDTLVDGTKYPLHRVDGEEEIVDNIFGAYGS